MKAEGKFQTRELTATDMEAILKVEKKNQFISWSRKILFTKRTSPPSPLLTLTIIITTLLKTQIWAHQPVLSSSRQLLRFHEYYPVLLLLLLTLP
jgi:hypothetical protein